jgi:3-oxoacyl-(acyl-carrier-protein) synthase
MQDKHDEIPHTRDEMRNLRRRSIDILRVGTLNFVPTFQNSLSSWMHASVTNLRGPIIRVNGECC